MMTDKTGMTSRTLLKATPRGPAGSLIALRRAGDDPTEWAADHQDQQPPYRRLGRHPTCGKRSFFAKEGPEGGCLFGQNPGGRPSPAHGRQLDVTGINVGGLASAAVQTPSAKAVANRYQGRPITPLRSKEPDQDRKRSVRQDHCVAQLRKNVHALIWTPSSRRWQGSSLQFRWWRLPRRCQA